MLVNRSDAFVAAAPNYILVVGIVRIYGSHQLSYIAFGQFKLALVQGYTCHWYRIRSWFFFLLHRHLTCSSLATILGSNGNDSYTFLYGCHLTMLVNHSDAFIAAVPNYILVVGIVRSYGSHQLGCIAFGQFKLALVQGYTNHRYRFGSWFFFFLHRHLASSSLATVLGSNGNDNYTFLYGCHLTMLVNHSDAFVATAPSHLLVVGIGWNYRCSQLIAITFYQFQSFLVQFHPRYGNYQFLIKVHMTTAYDYQGHHDGQYIASHSFHHILLPLKFISKADFQGSQTQFVLYR